MLNGRVMRELRACVAGMSLGKRKDLFYQELKATVNLEPNTITVYPERLNFLESIVPHLTSNLKRALYIHFEGEQGVDCGGPRREFYDTIG